MGIVLTSSTPWTRVSASRRSWRFPSETRCWLQRPLTTETRPIRIREKYARSVWWSPPTHAPGTVAALAASLPPRSWYRRTVSEGTKGPIAYEFARQRVTLCKEGLPDRTVWLVIKRTLGASPRIRTTSVMPLRARPCAPLCG